MKVIRDTFSSAALMLILGCVGCPQTMQYELSKQDPMAYVFTYRPGVIYAVNINTRRYVGRINLTAEGDIAHLISEDRWLYGTLRSYPGKMFKIDTYTNSVNVVTPLRYGSIIFNGLLQLSSSPGGQHLYVLSAFGSFGGVTVVQANNLTVYDTISINSIHENIAVQRVAISKDGTRLAVTAGHSRQDSLGNVIIDLSRPQSLFIIDPLGRNTLFERLVGLVPLTLVFGTERNIYVLKLQPRTIEVIDSETNQPVDEISVASPFEIADILRGNEKLFLHVTRDSTAQGFFVLDPTVNAIVDTLLVTASFTKAAVYNDSLICLLSSKGMQLSRWIERGFRFSGQERENYLYLYNVKTRGIVDSVSLPQEATLPGGIVIVPR